MLVDRVATELARLFYSAEAGGLTGQAVNRFPVEAHKLFLNLWHQDYEQNQVEAFLLDKHRPVAFPFANIVAQRFRELKPIYIQQFRGNELDDKALTAFETLST